MCFSAGASFTAGVMLSYVGTETYRKVHKPCQLVLASIPIFFAVQQFSEGVVWLTIGKTGYEGLLAASANLFLIFAHTVWPIMVPLSVYLLEENISRKRIMLWLLVVGAVVALYYLYGLAFRSAVNPQIIKSHVVYQHGFPKPAEILMVGLYLVAALMPLFLSTIKKIHWLGIIMTLSFIVSAIFYFIAFASVWCFFAALISFGVFYIIKDSHKIFQISGITEVKCE